jgi:hypothetical protein
VQNTIIKNLVSAYFPFSHYTKSRKILEMQSKNYWNVDELITNQIESGEPSLIGRIGGVEASVLGSYLDVKYLETKYDPSAIIYSKLIFKRRLKQLSTNAGAFLDTSESLNHFFEEYRKCFSNAELFGCWGNTFTWCEYYFLKSLSKDKKFKVIPHMATSPWVETYKNSQVSQYPWSKSLTNKKVLIISPFAKSFSDQFPKINKIFPTKLYPDFSPVFLCAPLTQGRRDLNWKITLEETKKQIEFLDFDIALISAGGYALPLANFVKEIGKIGINCGGELQLFFGVLGKRWDNNVKFAKFFNEHWVRPREDEKPLNWQSIEGGCYW